METEEFKGYNGTLILGEQSVTIKRGFKDALITGGHLRGNKTLPYKSIVAVQLKKAGLLAGYIQLTLTGGSEAKGGVFQSTKDENSINFYASQNSAFEKAKTIIEQKITGQNQGGGNERINDLEKLHSLKEKGILTEEEYLEQKKRLLA